MARRAAGRRARSAQPSCGGARPAVRARRGHRQPRQPRRHDRQQLCRHRSIVYGKTVDHVRRLGVLLADGSRSRVRPGHAGRMGPARPAPRARRRHLPRRPPRAATPKPTRFSGVSRGSCAASAATTSFDCCCRGRPARLQPDAGLHQLVDRQRGHAGGRDRGGGGPGAEAEGAAACWCRTSRRWRQRWTPLAVCLECRAVGGGTAGSDADRPGPRQPGPEATTWPR